MIKTDVEFRPHRGEERSGQRTAAVIVAVEQFEGEKATLLRAYAASRLLGTTLEVLYVFPQQLWANPLFPHENMMEAIRSMNVSIEHRREVEAWVREILGRRKGVQVTARCGDLGEEIIGLLDSLDDASLIVVGGTVGRNAELVNNLVMTTEIPVFIARGETSNQEVLAATDLYLGGYPVLRSAARMTSQADGALIALHNVPPAYFTPDLMWTLGATPDAVRQERAATLERDVAEAIGVPIKAVVCSEPETKVAILTAARERDVDVVVIGVRCDHLPDSAQQRALVKDLLHEAQRSVLVTPVFHNRRTPLA